MPTEVLSDSTLLLITTIAAVVAAIAIVAAVGFRLSRSHRELGTEAEHATFAALHSAAVAGEQLRNGLEPAGALKASRQLRTLLNCAAFAMTDNARLLAWDGSGAAAKQPESPVVMELVAKALSNGRTQVASLDGPLREALGLPPHDGDLKAAVISPLKVDSRPVGAVIILSKTPTAGLVRATNEVATWVSAQLEIAELSSSRTLLAEAEVRALRAQISPHFIYNSLNAIASFINTDPQRARDLVVEFADFTRYSFRRHGDFTTLAEELRCIDRYLLLENARFGDRLQVSLQIAPEVLSTVIPFLSLQPLVENAVRHGLEAKVGSGTVQICARDLGAYTEVTIEDDGVGMDPEQLRLVLAGQQDGHHVGLRNVDARLRQVYGEDHGLTIDTGLGHGMLITMTVPKNQPGHDA
ncbi:two-component system, LytT family, sensor kinase [Arthrobacter alpinus]|uniref:Two-component system, LytT family, sensor kinase n=1 Tax=Arthrobacter alpinus TaxID=656366 RepID=A0A1H5K128_9MICC|nr:histidine kinase [Arthrobacter alpinus]SEE58472.1 two-component system, LytT family, sensor kinase [Arthrobacter alpinus]